MTRLIGISRRKAAASWALAAFALLLAASPALAASAYPAGGSKNTNIGLNLLSLFSSRVVLQSPSFKLSGGEAAALRLDRSSRLPTGPSRRA
jgi:hypothetical protein